MQFILNTTSSTYSIRKHQHLYGDSAEVIVLHLKLGINFTFSSLHEDVLVEKSAQREKKRIITEQPTGEMSKVYTIAKITLWSS